MALNIPVILGTVRTNRLGLRVARYVVTALTKRGHHAPLIDPAEHPLPLLDKMYKEYPPGEAPAELERIAGILKKADAHIVVSAEYNHSIPPALSNLMDHFLEEYFWKPSGIVCYSPSVYAGVRAAMQLRAMLAELGTPSIPSLLPFGKAHEMLHEDGTPTGDRPGKAADKFFGELEWYAEAFQSRRAKGTPY